MNAHDLRDPIFKGCTRPAMWLGVPFAPLVAAVGAILIPAIWMVVIWPVAAAAWLALLVPVLSVLRQVTRHDDQRLKQTGLSLRLRLWQRNRKFWGASAYCPVRVKRRGGMDGVAGFDAPAFDAQVRREIVVADFVPYSSHITEHVIRTREGDYLRIWRIAGIAFEATDPVDILTRHNGFNQFVRSLGTGRAALWTHRIRRRTSDRLSTQYDNAVCRELAQQYYSSFSGYRMMAGEQFLTVIYRPTRTRMGRFIRRNAARTLEQVREDELVAIKALNDIAHDLESSLQAYDPEPLGIEMRGVRGACGDRQFSTALEFLGYLVNRVWEPVPVPSGPIADALPSSRLFFAGEKIEVRTPNATHYGVMLDLKDYPEHSEPGILNPLLYGDYEYIESQSFSILDRASAKEALERQRGRLIAGEDAASAQIVSMDRALNDLINGNFVLGEYHYSLAVFGDTRRELDEAVSKARAALHDAGFQSAMVDLAADAAWFAQLPCNWKYRPREAKLSSRNFCGLSSFHNFATGKRDGNPWGEAITILKTPSGQPLYVNCHVTPTKKTSLDEKALANTMLIGQAGSGKTALELFLLMMLTKYGTTIVFYDKDRGGEIAVRAMGGTYLTMKRGEPTGLNPFQLEPTPVNVDFWLRLVRRLVTGPDDRLTARDERDIWLAVSEVSKMARPVRRLSMVRQLLPKEAEDSLYERLGKWCRPGRLGWVLDNPEDRIAPKLANCRVFGFDDTELLDDTEVSPVVTMVMLHLTESRIDGRRFVYVMAEFWKRLQDAVFTDFAENRQRTIRKQNGFGIFDTQSPSEVLASAAARALIEQTATFFFLPNPRADYDEYVNGFKLTHAEFEIVRTLGESSRRFLIKQGSRAMIGTLNLGGLKIAGGDALDVLSGTTDNVGLLDEIRAHLGDDPARWLPEFQRRLAERRRHGKDVACADHAGQPALPRAASTVPGDR